MNFLITGGTGFLGKYIVDELQKNDNNIFITTRHPNQSNHILADFEKGVLDLESNKDFQCRIDDLIVIHSAGKAHSVPKSETEKKSFFDINIEGTKLLLQKLEMLPHLPKSLVFISSVSVYGAEKGLNITETAPLNANDPYGKSKIEAEKLILQWGKKHNIIIGILRLPLIAGKNPPGNLKSMINGIKSGRYFRIGKGTARKSMVWASDVASILPDIAIIGGIYNLTDGYHPGFAELEDAITNSLHRNPVKNMPIFIANIVGIAGSTIEFITHKKMPINKAVVSKITSPLTFSDDKARTELGWKPSGVLSHINEMLS